MSSGRSRVLVVFGVTLVIYSPVWNFSDTWIARIFRLSRIDLVVLIVVVADMVFKPGS
jgi:hypothetical protein